MNCRQIVEFLMEYLEGELPENVRMCFDMHMQVCPDCVRFMQSYKKTVELVKTCECDDKPPSNCEAMPEGLVKAILAAKRGECRSTSDE